MYQLAGYVGRGKPLDWIIRAGTLDLISHTEIVCGDWWASASWRDGGVKVRKIIPRPAHWTYLDLPLELGEQAFDFIAARQGAPYDLPGALFGPTLGIRTEVNGKWFCHEIAGAGLGIEKPWRLNGTRLFRAAADITRQYLGKDAV